MISARPFSPSAACLSQVRQLYETAFPVEEQIPWPDLMELMQLMPLDFRTYHMPDGTFAGFTIIYRRAGKTGGNLSETKAYDWFWYFAVEPHLRGRGIGQEILSRLIAEYRENRSSSTLNRRGSSVPMPSSASVAVPFICATDFAIPEWSAPSMA